MTKEPFIAHSELTNEIYIVIGKEKYRVTEQVIKAVIAIKALKQEPILDKIYADIQRLRGCSCSCSDGIIDDVEDILDKYKAETEADNV